jgi:hypothetical protein
LAASSSVIRRSSILSPFRVGLRGEGGANLMPRCSWFNTAKIRLRCLQRLAHLAKLAHVGSSLAGHHLQFFVGIGKSGLGGPHATFEGVDCVCDLARLVRSQEDGDMALVRFSSQVARCRRGGAGVGSLFIIAAP